MTEFLSRNWVNSIGLVPNIDTINFESTTNSTDSELILQIYNVVYRMLMFEYKITKVLSILKHKKSNLK